MGITIIILLIGITCVVAVCIFAYQQKTAINYTVQGLREQLARYEHMLKELEKDRLLKYGNLENELKNVGSSTMRLQQTTQQLNNILGNVKLRGQWGERMAEDIITHAGLMEGINYLKQRQLEFSPTRPDYTFLLPDGHKVNMDVKFPLDNYLNMVNAQHSTDKENHQKEFLKNVKDRIKELHNRDYINPSEKTLDFVLLFIPNEGVFALIQQEWPQVMDEALKQKVVLCSPFTLYAMLDVIRQAHEHFRYEKDLQQIIHLIEQFGVIYGNLKIRFDAMGEALNKAQQQYQDITQKNFKQLDTKIRQIDETKKGQLLSDAGV